MSVENLKQKRIFQLSEMLTQNPDDLFVKYALALEYASSDDKNQSIQLLTEIIEKDSAYIPAYYQLGILYAGIGLNQKALEFLQSGLEIARQNGSNNKTIGEFKSLIDEILFS